MLPGKLHSFSRPLPAKAIGYPALSPKIATRGCSPFYYFNFFGSVGEKSNIANQCFDITLTEDAAPRWHKLPFTIKNVLNQIHIVEAVGLM